MSHNTSARFAFVRARWLAEIVDRALTGFAEIIPASATEVFDVPGAWCLRTTADGAETRPKRAV